MSPSEIREKALDEIEKAADAAELEKLRIKYLGRKGEVTALLRSLKDLPIEKRRKVGPEAQALQRDLEVLFEKKKSGLMAYGHAPMTGIDLTAPGRKKHIGHLHPLTKIEQEVRHIFLGMNFSIVEGPEIENEFYNFDALNIPPNHPAREMWDTFWLRKNEIKNQKSKIKTEKLLLRTHTSPVQIRYLEQHKPPFQIIVPGRVFRHEATDASHEINFYQVEGLMVGKHISLANFKFVIQEFLKKLFGQEIQFRFRPSYFPFTEPSVEVDIKIPRKSALSPRGSASDSWLEVMGAGMVHPHVFEAAHYNPRPPAGGWQGFAFGVGLDRLAMIKYKIPDIRLFYSGDVRFIKQF